MTSPRLDLVDWIILQHQWFLSLFVYHPKSPNLSCIHYNPEYDIWRHSGFPSLSINHPESPDISCTHHNPTCRPRTLDLTISRFSSLFTNHPENTDLPCTHYNPTLGPRSTLKISSIIHDSPVSSQLDPHHWIIQQNPQYLAASRILLYLW